MTGIETLIRANEDGTLAFGDCTLESKKKKDGFEYGGDVYEVKTFREITKLECNESFVYESVPGTVVDEFQETEDGMSFLVRGEADAQLTVGLTSECDYRVTLDGKEIGVITTDLGGKLSFNVPLEGSTRPVDVKISEVRK